MPSGAFPTLKLVVVFAALRFVVTSPFGVLCRGIRQDKLRVQAMGVFVFPVMLKMFVISGAVAGIGGARAYCFVADLARAVATEACRRAANCGAFIDRVRDEIGIELEIISTAEEARLVVSGCAPLLHRRCVVRMNCILQVRTHSLHAGAHGGPIRRRAGENVRHLSLLRGSKRQHRG